MQHKTYVEIYNLITDVIGYHEDKLEGFLKGIDELDESDGAEEIAFLIKRIKKHRAKIKEYSDLLERFENEVEEPRQEGLWE